MMNDEEVDFSSFIRLGKQVKYITSGGIDGNEAEKFYLGNEPNAATQYMVGPDTTCYAARRLNFKNLEFIVKFAWR